MHSGVLNIDMITNLYSTCLKLQLIKSIFKKAKKFVRLGILFVRVFK